MSEIDQNIGHRKRLKDRFLKSPRAIAHYELLEMILFNAIPRKDVKPIAKKLLSEGESFGRTINLDQTKIKNIDASIPDSVFFQFSLLKECVNRILKHEAEEKIKLGDISSLQDYLKASMGYNSTEQFRVIYLNTKNQIISDEVQEAGTIDQTQVYPREILKRAIFHGSSSLILAHNHPSGSTKPSKADIFLTDKIVDACKTIDVTVHDHVIIANNDIFSFRSHNLIKTFL